MIFETIVTTLNEKGRAHIAPMGVHTHDAGLIIMPFRPSLTLDNLLETGAAVVNFTDDVRVFAGCLTGRRDWPLSRAERVKGRFLSGALAHCEVELSRVEDDGQRPKLFCNKIHTVNHAPFLGFNRAQHSVLEAAILVSRLGLLPREKIDAELDYLRIGLSKTAGDREMEAWNWLMEAVDKFYKPQTSENDKA
ncbi:MAG: DUF447 domain-containing protein [Gammaproteobacteria bacterium]